ncbi:MAG: YihY/virulence factor BrkB family protein [Neomegalonema sp.]|nr:YihY/virulence factor BrkB family protein [Neomegalonema sp.]
MGSWFRYIWGVTKETLRRFDNDDQLSYAGHLAFTLLLSFGPFVVVLILAAEALVPDSVSTLKGMILAMQENLIIPNTMADVLVGVIDSVANNQSGKSQNLLLVLISGLVGLWAGSNAFESARKGFNEAYDVRDTRKLPAKRMQSLLLAAVMASLFILLAVSIVVATITLGVLGAAEGKESEHIAFVFVPALVGGPLFLILLIGIHLTLPRGFAKRWALYLWADDETADARPVRVPVLPGVIWSVVLWIFGAIGFSVLLSTVMSLEGKHGGLAGVVATLLFFYMSSAIIFLGAQINIAMATIGPDGKPQWPHPSLTEPPEGYDPAQDAALQVLLSAAPRPNVLSRFWYYICGGSILKDVPEHVRASFLTQGDTKHGSEEAADGR